MAETTVNTPGKLYEELSLRYQWPLIQNLIDGTVPMRDAREDHLPRFPKESLPQYNARLKTSFLFGMFADAIDTLVAKPFSEPIGWEKGLPESLETLLLDVDGNGTTANDYSTSSFRDGIGWGMGATLVDFTQVPENLEGGLATIGQEENRGARPTFIRITPTNLIDWNFGELNGERVISEIRFRGQQVERDPEDDFVQKLVENVTHYTWKDVTVWKKDEDKKWIAGETVPHTFGRVPIDDWYTQRLAPFQAKPPLLALAEVNAEHWQVNSDFRNLLHTVAVAILFTKGLGDKKEFDGVIGGSKMIRAKDTDADAKWVEVSGQGLGQLRETLTSLDKRAESLGREPTDRGSAALTATGEIRSVKDALCKLQAWVIAQEEHMGRCVRLAAKWTGDAVPEDFAFTIHRGFTIGPERDTQIAQMQLDAKEGRIPTALYLAQAQKLGVYPDDMDVEATIQEGRDEAADKAAAFLEQSGGTDPFAPKGDDDDDDTADAA